MIKFIQDYTTKALPPEKFKAGDEVSRSDESERYFVQMGVAGYLVDGTLVDQDYTPIVVETVTLPIVTPDRRFAGGRGGEMLGLDAPQRASTGPGNSVMHAALSGGVDPTLSPVEVTQLQADLATSVQQLADHQDSTTSQIAELTDALTKAQGARETALADLGTVRSENATLVTERDAARADLGTAIDDKAALTTDRDAARADLATSAARVTDLETQLAAATAPAGDDASKTKTK